MSQRGHDASYAVDFTLATAVVSAKLAADLALLAIVLTKITYNFSIAPVHSTLSHTCSGLHTSN